MFHVAKRAFKYSAWFNQVTKEKTECVASSKLDKNKHLNKIRDVITKFTVMLIYIVCYTTCLLALLPFNNE